MEKIIFFSFISLVPVLAWFLFFQKQHKCNIKFSIFAFLAGMLSIIPIKLYEKYWDIAIFSLEHINIFEYIGKITESPSIQKLISFIIASAGASIFIFIFVLLLMFLFEILSGDNTFNVFKKKIKKISEAPFLFISVGTILGILAFFLAENLHKKIWFFCVVGILEEFVKHLVVRFSDDEKIHTIADAVFYSIMVALGFAFIENILYTIDFLDNSERGLDQTGIFILLRSIIPVMAHVCFSAILGYFYGIAHFSKEIYYENRKKHWFLEGIHKILHVKRSVLFHEEKMMEGLILAMILHAMFNSFLEFQYIKIMIIFLGALFLWVINKLHLKKANKFYNNE